MATVINALALQDALGKRKASSRACKAPIAMQQVAEPFIRRRADASTWKKGRVGDFRRQGTGNPYFSTDTAAALRRYGN